MRHRGDSQQYDGNEQRRWSLRRLDIRLGRMIRSVLMIICFCCVMMILVPTLSVAAEACGNESIRAQQGATYLPRCRAYELVTPAEKDSGEPKAVEAGLQGPELEGLEGAHAAVNGNRMAWTSEYPLPGSASPGLSYLSTRGPNGWLSENVIPPQSVENGLLCPNLVLMAGYSSDLSVGILADGFGQGDRNRSYLGDGLECGHDEPRLVPNEPQGYQNLFYSDNESHTYSLVNVTPAGVEVPKPPLETKHEYFPASYLAGSEDLKHVAFEEELQLTPEAPVGDDLYEWSLGGAVRLVTILPDGSSTQGRLAGSTRNTSLESESATFVPTNIADFRHAMSSDGSRVYFQAGGNLYLREHADQPQSPLNSSGECIDHALACTVQVDLSEIGGSGGGGEFQIATSDGSRVFFTDEATADLTSSTAPGSGLNLYEYDVADAKLVDLTSASEAGVEGISGASDDGSFIYFVASGSLTTAASAGGSIVATPTPGEPNLYLEHDGTTTFISTLSTSDKCDWSANTGCLEGTPGGSNLTARVPADGGYIGFTSAVRITGFDNRDQVTSDPDSEVFLYEAAADRLVCTSCGRNGIRPVGPSVIRYPALAGPTTEMRNAYPQRNVSESGQVFFETSNPLVSRDVDGQRDVYEYSLGQTRVISSGLSEENSYFLDATPSGSDVFFATAAKLVPSDHDSSFDYYDARVGGGFVEEVPSIPTCTGEGCRGAVLPSAPNFEAPSSMTFAPVESSVTVKSKPAKKRVKRSKKKKPKGKKKKKKFRGKERSKKKGRSATQTRVSNMGRKHLLGVEVAQ